MVVPCALRELRGKLTYLLRHSGNPDRADPYIQWPAALWELCYSAGRDRLAFAGVAQIRRRQSTRRRSSWQNAGNGKDLREGLSFDDVLLVPLATDVTPAEVDPRTVIAGGITPARPHPQLSHGPCNGRAHGDCDGA